MTTQREDLGDVLDGIAHSEERSPLFWWLYKHHAEIVQAAQGRRIRWGPLQARVQARGLTDGAGNSPTAETVRKTWWNVRREIARAREAHAAEQRRVEAKVQPSRLPAAWQPTPLLTPTPRAQTVPRTEPPRRTESPSDLEADLPEDVRANLAALDSQFAWADRFVNPPKRKD